MDFIEIAKSGDLNEWRTFCSLGNDPNEWDHYGTTPLSWIVKSDHIELFKLAIEMGADPFFPYRMAGSVFFDLLSQNKTNFLEVLIATKESWSSSKNLLVRDKSGNTIFHITLAIGNEEVWEILSDLITPSAWELRNEEGRTIFLEAVANANLGFLSSVLDENPDLIKATDREKKNALHLAAERNLSEDVEFLAGIGFNLEEKDATNNTPLFLAASADAVEAMMVLLENGADILIYGENTESITRMLDREKFHQCLKLWRKELYKRLKQIDFENEKEKLETYLVYLRREKPLNQAEIAQGKLLDYL